MERKSKSDYLDLIHVIGFHAFISNKAEEFDHEERIRIILLEEFEIYLIVSF